MTDQEWQERYRITSAKGKLWTRPAIRYRAVAIAASLSPTQPHFAIQAAVQLLLDDPAFMRARSDQVPTRVIEDAAMDAYLNLTIPDRHPETTALVAELRQFRSAVKDGDL